MVISSIKYLDGLEVEITFRDGMRRVVDMTRYMEGPLFQELADDGALFRAGIVDPELSTIVWPSGADICPDLLYKDLDPV